MGSLVRASFWLDDGLQAYLLCHTGVSVPRVQSMMMVCIADGIDRPLDLAKRMHVSKQAIQQSLKELVAKDLILLETDPNDGRQKLIKYTQHGRKVTEVAKEGALKLEAELALRIGAKQVAAIREALALDWGPRILEGL